MIRVPEDRPALASEHPDRPSLRDGADVAVIILTWNEELNIAQALASVCGWARQVFVFDSFSTDATVEVARRFDCTIVQHPFADYATQRNASLRLLPIEAEWIFVLDADEWMPDALRDEIAQLIRRKPEENAFFVRFRVIWMGKWVRRGIYPTWIGRLFRHGKAHYDRGVNEHLAVEGATGRLANDIMHEDRKPVGAWIAKHNRYATLEARELIRSSRRAAEEPRFWGPQHERVQWLRQKVWGRMPPLVRPFFYFGYRYFLRGGFLDGRAGFVFHFLQALWFQMLIDIKYLEALRIGRSGDDPARAEALPPAGEDAPPGRAAASRERA